ncbi:SDR family oxidoreductase [Sulfobacillus harzensis]|uniref:SDR family oxidoreductase n=1 Tax=Sulfobacillus harzensis TaxID=2729629 RepID=A0A7Y0L2H2_9FIRM|nr:SDR family oxidoreductase [Sulfobacillus harzensis]NMP22092.1 SDR family oxidoreductase [Sulfobacillus harzensis]
MLKNTLFSLEGKTALVTGARRGLGRAMAVALAEAGADIIGVSAQMEPHSLVQDEVAGLGRQFWAYACDLSDRNQVYELIATIQREFDRPIDILVNNAGTILRAPAVQYSDKYWDEVINTNLNAPFVLSRELGGYMVQRGAGKVIFIASLLSFQGGILVPGYAASKGGIVQLTKALANEWAKDNVQVNAIAPGYMATDNTAPLRSDPVRSRDILNRIPAGRWGTPDDVKGAVVFLASDASNYVTGTVLTVDGGWMAR